ncbi:MAG: hypothetical protein IJW42_01760 [Alistipes sp.]|nr:hypothetical protein [Alistipes sp.]
MRYIIVSLTLLLAGLTVTSCENITEHTRPQTYDICGKVEKGPYISGSTITIQPLDEQLQVLGSMYNTTITDNLGNFVLGKREFLTPYADLMANGYFFNEVKGELSIGTLTLRGFADLRDCESVNVNILTHLKYARIQTLVDSGISFPDANKQAQKELFEAFGLGDFTNEDTSTFSIMEGNDNSAVLIAISSLLLMDRSEAALTEYLAKLSRDFGDDGLFSETNQSQINDDKRKLAAILPSIRENITSRYTELGISVNVKDLSRYIDWNSDGLAGNEILGDGESVRLDKQSIDIPNEGGSYTIRIDSPIPLFLEPQVDYEISTNPTLPDQVINISMYEGYDESFFMDKPIECECQIEENTLRISVSKLTSRNNQHKDILLYDYIGNIVASLTLNQSGGALNIPISETPLLGNDATTIVEGIANTMAYGLSCYNIIEQYYCHNKSTNLVEDDIYPSHSMISKAWGYFYTANRDLLQIKQLDSTRLNVYADYCNVLSAIYYSNLVYAWGNIPYITDYEMFENLYSQGGIPSSSPQKVFDNLKANLTVAIANLPEKRNESIKDANGFFFASKDVARVLLANIHMYEGNYNLALPLLQKVIENGFYNLDASTNFKPSINTDIIDITESSEVIFALIYNAGTRNSVRITQPDVMPYITLSDVYLSIAECLYKAGKESDAEQYITDVVEAKNITLNESKTLMKIKELRESLLLHGGTFFAFLKRSGLAISECQIEEYQLLFPIPQDELNTNKYISQNPGY